jgi:hypothetical protein
MMFEILVIQTTNNLSDERAEFLINDRLSFMRFLGFGLSDRVPDARTIWLFREKLTKAGAIGPLSVIHGSYLDPRGKVMDGPGLPVRVSRRLRSTYALSYGRDPMGAAAPGVLFCYGPKILTASAISPKKDFMFSRSTASVWPDEAGGFHDRDRLPVQSRLAPRAQRQWRRQSQPW